MGNLRDFICLPGGGCKGFIQGMRRSLQIGRKSKESLDCHTEEFQVYLEDICFKQGSGTLRLARWRDLSLTRKVDEGKQDELRGC